MEKPENETYIESLPPGVEANTVHTPKTNLRNVMYILMIGTGMLAGGAANGVIATTLAQPTFVAHMSLDGPNALSLMGGTNGTFYAGGFFGVFFGAWSCDFFGRRRAMWLTGLFNIISSVLCASSVNIAMFIAVRYVSRPPRPSRFPSDILSL